MSVSVIRHFTTFFRWITLTLIHPTLSKQNAFRGMKLIIFTKYQLQQQSEI